MKSSHLPASVLTEEEFAWAVGIVKSRSVVLDNQVRAYRFTFSHYVLSIDSSQSSSPSALSFAFLSLSLSLSLSSLSLSTLINFPTTLSLPLTTCLFHPLSSFLSPLTQSLSLSLSVPASGCLSLSFFSLSPSFSHNLYSLSIKHPIFHSNKLIDFIEIFQIRSLFYRAWISLDLILSLPQSLTHPLPEYLGGK